ncbi:MAG: response regulator [Alphaproteobacteria bacterium]|nr:response regulator [Alphaproteobacteria bacterium]
MDLVERFRRFGPWITICAIGLAFVAAAAFVTDRLRLQAELIGATYRTGTWSVVQAEHEFLRLREAVRSLQAAPGEAAREAVQTRFDIFWSRIPIVLESDEAVGVREIPEIVAGYGLIAAQLPVLEGEIAALDPARPATVAAVLARLDTFGEALRVSVRRALMQDDYVYNRARLHGLVVEITLCLGALALSGFVLLACNARQLRRTAAAYAQAKAAEARSAEASARLTQALHAISEGFILLDADDRIVLVNERFKSFYPSVAGRLAPGADFRAIIADAVADVALEPGETREQAVARRLTRFRDCAGPWEQRLADGRTLLVGERRTADGGTVSIRTDISERARGEAERLDLHEQLNHAQRMEAIGRLAGGIAHDFNNILASMLGYARFIADDTAPDQEIGQFAAQILKSGQRAKELVQQILVYSRADKEVLEPIGVLDVVGQTASMLRATLPPRIRLIVDRCEGSPQIMGSTTRLTQVLMNLAVNAADAIGERDGDVRIAVSIVETDGGCADGLGRMPARVAGTTPMRIQATAAGVTRMWIGLLSPPGRYVRVSVRDNGSGIERAVLERMFEPFFTTKERNRGTGLGLAAVLGIVSSHRGAITVETRAGAGTTFSVYLPLEAGLAAGAAQAPAPEPVHGSGHVLVADDEPEVARTTAIALERAGFTVTTVDDGAAALARLTPGHDFALVVTDQVMPRMTGVDLLRALRARGDATRLMICTGFAEAIDEQLAASLGAGALLYKPVDPHVLAATARDLLRGTTERAA